jgi:hypothetical protein
MAGAVPSVKTQMAGAVPSVKTQMATCSSFSQETND